MSQKLALFPRSDRQETRVRLQCYFRRTQRAVTAGCQANLFVSAATPSVHRGTAMTFVYRYYDQPELERQLNARATVSDTTPFLTRYASESARMRSSLRCRIGVSYGSSEPERLDIFPAATGAPIFVFLHGGFFRALDSADSSFM